MPDVSRVMKVRKRGGGGKEESSTLKESSRLYLCVIRGVREEI